ncbi:MAG TPA: glycerophosphodiester phosphodiesterase family protein [Verrucomicrobiae bacterium]|nr:glycerophosphodiester phosphodiesterase family protein [Verrucomicrobiae bacterium]
MKPARLFFVLPFILLALRGEAGNFSLSEPMQPPRATQVIARRGASGQAPENTRAALDRCIADGFEWAEVDVRLTKDGQHVLAHDSKITGATNDTRVVNEHTLEELRQMDPGSAFAARYAGERILPLPDCLRLAKGRLNLCLDCKAVNPEQLAREILDAGMENQVVVYGDLAVLARVARAGNEKVATMAKWHPGMDIASWSRTNGLAAVEINADEATPDAVKSFHTAGLKVQTKNLGEWDKPAFWDKSFAAGVDWIQTDLAEEVLARELWRAAGTRPVRISCHRGANRYAPENTLPAFEKAIRLGVDFVEFDVRTTSDGKFYLLHDARLDRTTTGQGPISGVAAADVATLSAGLKFGRPFADIKVPPLDDFLGATAGRIDLYFDAKAIPPEALSEAVERFKMAERTVVYQSADYLLRLKAINPRIRALPPLSDPAQIPQLAANLKPYAVDAAWKILSKDVIAQCHAAGILVFSDALGAHERIEDYQQAMDWGIDLIQTDFPLRVLRAIELRAAGPGRR